MHYHGLRFYITIVEDMKAFLDSSATADEKDARIHEFKLKVLPDFLRHIENSVSHMKGDANVLRALLVSFPDSDSLQSKVDEIEWLYRNLLLALRQSDLDKKYGDNYEYLHEFFSVVDKHLHDLYDLSMKLGSRFKDKLREQYKEHELLMPDVDHPEVYKNNLKSWIHA